MIEFVGLMLVVGAWLALEMGYALKLRELCQNVGRLIVYGVTHQVVPKAENRRLIGVVRVSDLGFAAIALGLALILSVLV